jgi:hypothetical protein
MNIAHSKTYTNMEKHRFKYKDSFIEIEAPLHIAEKFIEKYYPEFKIFVPLTENEV